MPIYDVLRTFISSPGDVTEEREIVQKVIDDINLTIRDTLSLEMQPILWENEPPLSDGADGWPEGKIQDKLNEEINKCKIFILILFKRYGSAEPGHKKSNTEREVDIAIDLLKKERKLMFLCYFRNMPFNPDPGPQERSVDKFRNDLERQGIWYKQYNKTDEFKELLIHALYNTLLRYTLSTQKQRALKNFWQLGITDRPTQPILGIIYPPMGINYMKVDKDYKIWLNHLSPNLVFEDYKCLNKLDKTLHLINFKNYGIFDTQSILQGRRYMNLFHICIPRNIAALERLEKYYSNDARFKFYPRTKRSERFLHWKSKDNKIIKIKSPLGKYLKLQRQAMDYDGEWHGQLRDIVAKDFAILARFNKKDSSSPSMKEGVLKEYFLAGIRGLGTWGAGWFIDRISREFKYLKDDEEIQLLLEVEYRDGRIIDVQNVSERPQEYFNEQNNLMTIKSHIRSCIRR